MSESLAHVGVLGMKWGVHKRREEEYRKKLTNITKGSGSQGRAVSAPSDIKRFKYRNQPLAVRAGKTAASLVIQKVITDVFTGRIDRYKGMSKAQIAKEVGKIAATTAANVALNDALAKSASKRYLDSGKKVPGTKSHIITKEDAIAAGINAGVHVAYIGAAIGGMKLKQAQATRQKNETTFNKWGANILTQKVNDVVWTDGDTAVIDNWKR